MEDLVVLCRQMKNELQGVVKSLATISKTKEQLLLENWVRKDQAMKILGVSSRTFQRLTHSGQLPCSKVNGMIYIKVSDIDLLLNSHYKA